MMVRPTACLVLCYGSVAGCAQGHDVLAVFTMAGDGMTLSLES